MLMMRIFFFKVSSVFQICHNKTVPDSFAFWFGRPSHLKGDDMDTVLEPP